MGVWGSSVFENDAAADWVSELLEEGQGREIDRALKNASHEGAEADDCSIALAAAEVVAAANGAPVRGLPKELKEWIKQTVYRPSDRIKLLAIRSVKNVRDSSELADLWKENARGGKKWRAGLDDLLTRLQAASTQPPATSQPKVSASADTKRVIKRLRDLDVYIQVTPAGQAKYVQIKKHVDDQVLAECLPFLSKTKVLRLGWGGMMGRPQTLETSDAAFQSLDQFKALQELHLDQTQISDVTLARLTRLTKLRELSLTATPITDDGLRNLADLTALESLELGLTAVSQKGLAHLGRLTNLKKLNLFKTAVTDDGLECLENMKKMMQLDLRYTKITGSGLRHLAGLTDLWILELDHTMIDDEGLSHLIHLSKLARLTVRGKQITDAALPTISRLVSLQGLVLENSNITDAAIEILAALPKLEIVHLAGTAITTEGARALRKCRPRMTVLGKDK